MAELRLKCHAISQHQKIFAAQIHDNQVQAPAGTQGRKCSERRPGTVWDTNPSLQPSRNSTPYWACMLQHGSIITLFLVPTMVAACHSDEVQLGTFLHVSVGLGRLQSALEAGCRNPKSTNGLPERFSCSVLSQSSSSFKVCTWVVLGGLLVKVYCVPR